MYRKVVYSGSGVAAAEPARVVKHGFLNAFTGCNFSTFDTIVLREAAAARGVNTLSAVNAFLVKAKGLKVKSGASAIDLKLPSVGFDGNPMPSDILPRQFYLSSDLDGADFTAAALSSAETPLKTPRCGLTGLFFTREDVVDNLMLASLEMKFGSPFWIRDNHPELGRFLELRQNSSGIQLAITAAVVPLDKIQTFPQNLMHSSVVSKSAPRGANALTGVVPPNRWFTENGPATWISLDQMTRHGLRLKSAANLIEAATLVEVDRWVLFNSDQLVVPGRLSLNRAVKGDQPNDDITKIFE